jgi:saccharopine dehydrogenase-like NADP-dependent oxidoreductase
MQPKTILLLGGYGNAGRHLARLLLQETDICLVIAGRSAEKAARAASELNRDDRGGRVVGIAADASDASSLKRALCGVDLVVVASSTARYARQVAGAALEAGIDYLDIQYSTQKIAALKSLAAQITAARCCFITDSGFHPGLPAALVRYAAPYFDRLEKANVGSVLKQDWASLTLPDDTIIELIEEINDFEPLFFKGGRWKKARLSGMLDYQSMDFGQTFGRQYCAPMLLEEMRSLPETIPSLKEAGFFVGGFNWFADWLVLPLAIGGLRIWPQGTTRPLAKLMKWGLNTFSKPPYGIVLKLEAQGIKDGQVKAMELSLYHADGYLFTAIPVAACLLQYLDGSIRRPGLWTQANLVQPERLVSDMTRMGVEVHLIHPRPAAGSAG